MKRERGREIRGEGKGRGGNKRKRKRRGRGSRKVRGNRRKEKGKRRRAACRGPRHSHARRSSGLPRAGDRGGPGCAVCSPGLVRSGRGFSPACLPSAAAWTAARPARAPAAPRYVGCAGGQRVPSALGSGAESAGGERVRAPCPPARPPAVTSSRPCRPLVAARGRAGPARLATPAIRGPLNP